MSIIGLGLAGLPKVGVGLAGGAGGIQVGELSSAAVRPGAAAGHVIYEDEEESILSLFDPLNPDIGLFNYIDDENIRLAGSEIVYYKYMRSESHDDVYMEERNKPIAVEGIDMFAHYDPRPIEENLGEFGIELENEQIFIFNKSMATQTLGREPIPGDIIKSKFQNKKYEIFEVQEDEFHAYGVYHLNCHAKLLREHPEIQDTPNFDEIKDTGGYIGN